MIVPQPPASAVAFVDAQHGWAGGSGGLLGTTDGRTFRVQVRAPIIGVSAFDRARAWALTGTGFVMRTYDGTHWAKLAAPHLFRLQFVDARVGFGMTRDGVLVRSGDAGRTWHAVHSPEPVQSECFASRRNGWAARGGTVWATGDGGQSWTRARLRAGPRELPDLGCSEGGAWVVIHEGAAAGTEGYHVFRSLAGAPWRVVYASPFQRRLPSIGNDAGPFTVLRSGSGVLAGSCAPCGATGTATLVSTSGRATWRGPALTSLSFLDSRDGWIVSGGRLRKTTDGGRHWRSVIRVP